MKKLLFLISFVMLLKPVLPVLDYIVNYEYISQELCINKEVPIMGCNGKCYLMKQLAKASESEKPVSSNKKHAVIGMTDLFFDTFAPFNPAFFSGNTDALNVSYSNLYAGLHPNFSFHPPAFIS